MPISKNLRFKVDDRVRFDGPDLSESEACGKIVSIKIPTQHDEWDYMVKYDDGTEEGTNDEDLTLLN